MLWCASRKIPSWTIEVHLSHNVERAETAGTMAVGMEGDFYEAPPSVKRALKQSSGQATILVRPQELSLKIGRTMTPLCMREATIGVELDTPAASRGDGDSIRGRHSRADARLWEGPATSNVASTSADQVARIGRAWTIMQEAWPEGHEVLALLTARIIPLKAKGVVSFSYRHRPGLSFINCFDRDNLDLIDDVIHENSHHHLNLCCANRFSITGIATSRSSILPGAAACVRSEAFSTRHSRLRWERCCLNDSQRGRQGEVDRLDGNGQD